MLANEKNNQNDKAISLSQDNICFYLLTVHFVNLLSFIYKRVKFKIIMLGLLKNNVSTQSLSEYK